MMIKYKVSDVAKDFGVQSKEIIAILADHNFAGKKSATALEEPELNVIFEHYTQKHNSLRVHSKSNKFIKQKIN